MNKTPGEKVLEKMAEALAAAANETQFKDVKIVREGTRIIVPEGMSYNEARLWLQRQEDAEEKTVAVHDSIPCFPLDGIVSLMRALKERYDFAQLQDTPGFWGSKPPMLVQVDLGNGEFETAPIGRIGIPMWEGGFIATNVGMQMALVLTGEIKRKFEPEVKEVIKRTREILNTKSIYRGRAFRLNLGFIAEERDFHPINDAPKFMNVENVNEGGLILNRGVEAELNSNIFLLIEQSEGCRQNGIPLKHGCLLMGGYGTGKTLTASVIASKCVRNKWTFMYLQTPAQLADALRLAQMYAPCVVFTEDIDDILQGGRDGDMNNLLNTLDGVDTKEAPIITILTSNHPEKIEPAFLRAGRIDTIIEMTAPDAETAVRFVHLYAQDDDAKSLLEPGLDLTNVGKAMDGFVPAFIAEAVQKAKRLAMYRLATTDITGKLNETDLLGAAEAKKGHIKMVNRPTNKTDAEVVLEAANIVGDAFVRRK